MNMQTVTITPLIQHVLIILLTAEIVRFFKVFHIIVIKNQTVHQYCLFFVFLHPQLIIVLHSMVSNKIVKPNKAALTIVLFINVKKFPPMLTVQNSMISL